MKAEELDKLAELAYPIIKDVYRELWNENQAYKKGYIDCQDTMQKDIDELLDFINTASFVLNKDEIEAIKLIQKHTKI